MPAKARPATIGQLKRSRYKVVPVREEMRRNLVRILKAGDKLFPGIVGFDDSVVPQLQNAILAGQDIVLLGERGQAKSRLIRRLVSLLDDEIPVIAGCEINDNPYDPVCRACKIKVEHDGNDVQLDWLPQDARYSEKLATPDISIADLIGEIDPIKVAEGRYLSDELTLHFGLIHAPIGAFSPSTNSRTWLNASRWGCSTLWKSGTCRSRVIGYACPWTCM